MANTVRRILIIDDAPAIHEDFRKLLCAGDASRLLDDVETELFGDSSPAGSRMPNDTFEIDSVLQGREGYELFRRKARAGRPYALAIVDMRMPPGWDGVETLSHLLAEDADLEACICSAYSDYSWHEVIRRLERPGLRLLKKPFSSRDVLDLAWSLTSRSLRRRAERART